MSTVTRKESKPADITELLSHKGYTSEQIESLLEKEALILPPTRYGRTLIDETEYELITPDTVNLKKLLSREIETELITDQKLEHRYLEHLGADIFVPFIIILSLSVWDIVKNIIANWLYDKGKSLSKGGIKPSARFEYEIKDDKKQINKHIVYEGPVENLVNILRETKE